MIVGDKKTKKEFRDILRELLQGKMKMMQLNNRNKILIQKSKTLGLKIREMKTNIAKSNLQIVIKNAEIRTMQKKIRQFERNSAEANQIIIDLLNDYPRKSSESDSD